eukprot:INCI15149.1.p1 GENE.INCI15149.1~~INCI15149.1.p1  ORF type:complete len:318 (+),score=49.19 INCI15149.1:144-1097(+)
MGASASEPIVACITGDHDRVTAAERDTLNARLQSGAPVVIRRAAFARECERAPLQWTRSKFRQLRDDVVGRGGSVDMAFCSFGGRSAPAVSDDPRAKPEPCPSALQARSLTLQQFLDTPDSQDNNGSDGVYGTNESRPALDPQTRLTDDLGEEFYVGFTVNDRHVAELLRAECIPQLPAVLRSHGIDGAPNIEQEGQKLRVDSTPWIFWGRAHGEHPVRGAAWHTDDLQASCGSFHLQVQGRKGWGFKRPVSKRRQWRTAAEYLGLIREEMQTVICEPGDVVVFANDIFPHTTWLPHPEGDDCASDSVSVEFQLHRE